VTGPKFCWGPFGRIFRTCVLVLSYEGQSVTGIVAESLAI
jgi:hypothetical protein